MGHSHILVAAGSGNEELAAVSEGMHAVCGTTYSIAAQILNDLKAFLGNPLVDERDLELSDALK